MAIDEISLQLHNSWRDSSTPLGSPCHSETPSCHSERSEESHRTLPSRDSSVAPLPQNDRYNSVTMSKGKGSHSCFYAINTYS